MEAKLTRSSLLRSHVLGLAVLVLLALAIRLTAGARAVDDAFISFRYALNLSDGLGLVYNPGEVVLGTSAPLYAVLLAVLARAVGTRSFPEVALWVNGLADCLSIVLVYLIARRLRVPRWPSILAAVVVALSPLVIRYSIGGMETSVLTAMVLSSAYLYLQKRELAACLLAGLAVWVRPDALAFAAALLITEGWRTRRMPWLALAVVVAAIGVEAILLSVIYGDPLPQSVLAKAHQVYHIEPATNFFQHIFLFSGLSLTGARGFGAHGLVVSPTPALNILATAAFLPLLAIWAIGIVRLVRDEARTLFLPLFPVIFSVTYSLLGLRGGLMAEWYLVPLVPFWLVTLFYGLATIGQGVQRTSFRSVVWALPLALLVMEMSGFNLGRNPLLPASLPLNVWTEREDLYQDAAEFLRVQGTDGRVVAASEIGALGYSCQCRILDTVGLVSPAVTPYYPQPERKLAGNYAVPPDLMSELEPDFLVSLEIFLRDTLLQDPRFLEGYELVWQAPTDAFDSRGLHIYARTSQDDGEP